MDKHTPGPWTCTEKDNRGWHSIRSSDYRTVAEIICQLPWEAEQNARLIAAAPEMLEILREMQQDMHDIGHVDRDTQERARALLAKIEGK